MGELITKLRSVLNHRERRAVVVLLFAMVLQAAAELVGIASIAPFMGVVADPAIIQRNDVLRTLYVQGGFETTTGFLTALGIGAVLLLTLSNTVSAATQWATLRLCWGTTHRLSVRMLAGYLAQPYGFFVQSDITRLHKNVLFEVQSAITGVLEPMMTLVARSLVTIAIVGLLVVVDPTLAAVVVTVLGGMYGIIYLLVRRRQMHLGRERVKANLNRYKVTTEIFGGIKDVKVLQRESAFVDRYAPASEAFTRTMAWGGAISVIPRYLLETIAFGGILLIVVYYLQAGEGLSRILPTLSLYALAGYRLMPALQQLFSAGSSIRFQSATLDELIQDLETLEPPVAGPDHVEPLPIQREIRFEGVGFRYPDAGRAALDDVSLVIPCNGAVGLVGVSGSGKTTLVDLLLGLYLPAEGRIEVDGVALDRSTLRRWRRQVGYVPQEIFFGDDTIARNIAFGVPAEEVDPERVERAARIAHLHDFVRTLPKGYDTMIGERGVRLSGGQRQRIGIARALYHDPAVLVLDEATSALDGKTEDAVMEAIRGLAGRKTVVLVTHRLQTVAGCDRIYLLEDGRVKDHGTYQELAAGSAAFRAMSNPGGHAPR